MSVYWALIPAALIGAFFVLMLRDRIGWALAMLVLGCISGAIVTTLILHAEEQVCAAKGGVLVHGACIERQAVIP